MKELKALISAKKLIALALTTTYIIMNLKGMIISDNFNSLFNIIVGAYFGYSVSSDKKA